jgi:Asp-tRNA(Asn)/Glu-tRNA(Gln) amidotransferase A subunit family amidase
MVPIALGTQTRGSVLRPASYCGVTGFKASYGLLPMEGVLPLASSLDTLGFFTGTPGDMLALWKSLGYSPGREETFAFGVPEPMLACEPEMANAFGQALSWLRKSDVRLRPIDISEMHDKLSEASNVVMFYEGARFHKERFEKYGSRLEHLADLVLGVMSACIGDRRGRR